MAEKRSLLTPRIIIHGGAGNITPDSLPFDLWQKHQRSLLHILRSTNGQLQDGMDALSAAVHAVKLFESNPLYNSGRGAVFTRTGTIELEASVMVSSGRRKRGAAVSLIKHVKHPIELAAEILRKGDEDDAGGAQGHVHVSGTSAEELASEWGLDTCEESYFWTRQRWEEHRRGIGRSWSSRQEKVQDNTRPDGRLWPDSDPSWNGKDYLPQGTVGCVVMDRHGTCAVATSTGGITNKLAGRIGDTPTFGAGFWAEEWLSSPPRASAHDGHPSSLVHLARPLGLETIRSLADCLPALASVFDNTSHGLDQRSEGPVSHAVAMSGTGNGDSFLRMSAVHTAATLTRFSTSSTLGLQESVTWMAGPGGQLQRSAEDRFRKTGEGQGGIIGIERVDSRTKIVFDFNCGGMFHAWYDDDGQAQCEVFHRGRGTGLHRGTNVKLANS